MKASSPYQGRQILYACGILALFVAMVPYTQWLNRRRDAQNLGEATIGQVDTGSFMLKLALLGGARGVAANVLWSRALDLQKVHDWDRLKLTVDQITKLQPHFLRVWSWQGWNLAYNVSVEWDAPEDKYEWIKQGINFLKEGVRNNEKSPDLRWDTAWTCFQKIGTADEAILLRRLFHDDDDIAFRTYVDSEGGSHTVNDNYMLAFGWFTKAIDLVDSGVERLASAMEAPVEYVDKAEDRKGHAGDLNFRAMPASALTRYAAGLEKASVLDLTPTFGERARGEWTRAKNAWVAFGLHAFPAHNRVDPKDVQQYIYIDDATEPEQYARRLASLNYNEGQKNNQWYWTDRWADTTHFRYWKDRCLAEMEKDGVESRKLFYDGIRAYKQADYPTAVTNFRKGLDLWRAVLEKHPLYRDDDLNKSDTGRIVQRYLKALANAGMERPKDVPFEKLVEGNPDFVPDPFDQTDMPVASLGGDTPDPAIPASK